MAEVMEANDMLDFKLRLAGMAKAMHSEMDALDPQERMKVVKNILETNDITYGVWIDKEQPGGIDFHVIKGANLLREIIASGNATSAKTGVVPCCGPEQAMAAELVFGDKMQ
jgi:hypothetical protein